jgi:ATP-binding cassette subfamily F protein uup
VEGDGEAREYVGGYYDYVRQRVAPQKGGGGFAGGPAMVEKKPEPPKPLPPKPASKTDRNQHRLTFKELHELDELPDRIAKLEAYIEKANAFLADPEVYQRDPAKFEKAVDRLAEAKEALTAAEERWLALEAKREEIEAQAS